jgi:hypothetical protein
MLNSLIKRTYAAQVPPLALTLSDFRLGAQSAMGIAVSKILPLAVATAALSLLAGCATTPPPRPPAARPAAVPVAPPPSPPPSGDWRDLPLSPGAWNYAAESSGSSARFGLPGAPKLAIRCDKATRMIHFALAGAVPGSGSLVVTTSYGSRNLPLSAGAAGTGEASLPAADSFLDRIAFSRGRVSYATLPTMPLLMTPAWAEPARVIEDCRG